jgi:hypothetical protein
VLAKQGVHIAISELFGLAGRRLLAAGTLTPTTARGWTRWYG